MLLITIIQWWIIFDEVTDKRMKALKEIEKDKLQAAKVYNNKVKVNLFKLEI